MNRPWGMRPVYGEGQVRLHVMGGLGKGGGAGANVGGWGLVLWDGVGRKGRSHKG